VASHLCQFIASSVPPDPAHLTRASDGLDQARVIVLDVADASADRPACHLFRRNQSGTVFVIVIFFPRVNSIIRPSMTAPNSHIPKNRSRQFLRPTPHLPVEPLSSQVLAA
jgi:hypothetical protein